MVFGVFWVVGGGGIVGGVSLDGVFIFIGEFGIVECFLVRFGGCYYEYIILLFKYFSYLSGVYFFYK